jgi:hypothetical protein
MRHQSMASRPTGQRRQRSGSAPFSPLSASSSSHAQRRAAGRHRADAINAMRERSKSTSRASAARSVKYGRRREGWCGGRRSGAALRTGSAAARRPKLAVSHDLRLSGFTAAERDQCEQLSEPKRRRTAPRATIVVPDADGNERTFRDYLTDTALGAVKLRQACEAAGALRVTKAARSATPIFPGMMCGSKLGARNKRGYPDRNVIEDYAASSASSVVALRGAQ